MILEDFKKEPFVVFIGKDNREKDEMEKLLKKDYQLVLKHPENDLHPETQFKFIQKLVELFNATTPNLRVAVITNSPYILTTLNISLEASILSKEISNEKRILNILKKEQWLYTWKFGCYEIKSNKVNSIIDCGTGLIVADIIDSVSEEISSKFDELLELKSFG